MPRQSLQGRTCGVSYAGTRASALGSIRMEPAEVLHKIARAAESVGSAAPHPVSGRAGNPSLETRCKRPQQT
ncbi:hypothetical protein FHR58_000826 [Xanthomonas arboricola]|nr:hypothetical protein [Xanthomonas arboricola]